MDTITRNTILNIIKLNRRYMNNTQKALYSLLKTWNHQNTNGSWLARTALRIPSAGSRLRDLRKERYGQFNVKCEFPVKLAKFEGKRIRPSKMTKQQTFYRVDVGKITIQQLELVFGRFI